MNPHSLSCQELVELVTQYLEGVMSESERSRFESHLASCQGCTTYIAQMRETIHLAGKLSEETIAPEAKDQLLNVFRNWTQDKP